MTEKEASLVRDSILSGGRMERKVKWWVVGLGVVLVIVGVLVTRAGLQPCAWLDIALKHSGCLYTLEEHATPKEHAK
jgi:hypothetical protein